MMRHVILRHLFFALDLERLGFDLFLLFPFLRCPGDIGDVIKSSRRSLDVISVLRLVDLSFLSRDRFVLLPGREESGSRLPRRAEKMS